MNEIVEMPAGEFKAKCLKLMDQVRDSGTEIVITKRGTPVAKLVPLERKERPSLWGCMEGTVEIKGDIIGPFHEEWEVNGDERGQ
ncbi:MAG: type II toxin-antitoxin system Phd/YefM family antitoxin [Kiloniellales bacterium]